MQPQPLHFIGIAAFCNDPVPSRSAETPRRRATAGEGAPSIAAVRRRLFLSAAGGAAGTPQQRVKVDLWT
jgi:hypothetical protein